MCTCNNNKYRKNHDLGSTGEVGGRDENDVDSEIMHEIFKNKNKILNKIFPGDKTEIWKVLWGNVLYAVKGLSLILV